jgi:hypothetical protein
MTLSTKRERKFRRKQSWRLAKKNWIYCTEEMCALYGVSRNTPANWIKQGLRPIDGLKPVAVEGSELNRFHKQRWQDSKRPVGDAEFYCSPCDRPTEPQSGLIWLKSNDRGAGSVMASCNRCGRAVGRFVNSKQSQYFLSVYRVNGAPGRND